MQNQPTISGTFGKMQQINCWICLQCGQNVTPLKLSKANYIVDAVLVSAAVLTFILVSFIGGGLILTGYFVYRIRQMSHTYNACPICESEEVIPSNSPLARSYMSIQRRSF